MNREQLVMSIADKTGMSKKAVSEMLNAFIETVTGALRQDDKVTLVGFGTWMMREFKARKARNPQTGAEMMLSAKKVVRWKASKKVQDSMN
jgi:DNA-binding protein HU-beta